MSHLSLSDVQATNLFQLQTLCLGLAKDRLGTSRHFDLTPALAEYLLELSPDQLWTLVANVGSHTLFPPRRDFLKLVQVPPPLARIIATSRGADPAPSR